MSLTIDRMFGGRRFNHRIKTDDPRVREAVVAMLDVLYVHRRAWFDAIFAGQVPALEAWGYYAHGTLAALPPEPESAMPLKERWERWIREARNAQGEPFSAKHQASLKLSLRYVSKYTTTWGGLPGALLRCRKDMVPAHPQTFATTKNACLAASRDVFGRDHAIYRACQAVESVSVTRNIDEQLALPVEVFRERVGKLDDGAAAMAWELALTGMGWKEYTEDGYDVLRHGIHIHGAKRSARDRLVPYIRPVLGPTLAYRAFHTRLKAVGLTPYQCRRCFIQWCARIGLAEFWQDYYAGHEPKRMTGTYQQPKAPTEAELIAHGKLFKAYIGDDASILSITRRA